MSPSASQIFDAARQLPQDERIEFATALWDTVEKDWEDDQQIELSPEWREEIARRIREADNGEGQWLSEEEFNNRLREKYGPLFD
jgi:putative addiction module component (TIGR02574 family)